MIVPETCGEIVHIGQILEPRQATSLGDTVLRLFAEHLARPTTQYTEDEAISVDASDSKETKLDLDTPAIVIKLGKSDQETVDMAQAKFAKVLDERVDTSGLLFDLELFAGTAGGGDWHIDGDKYYRLLVNLSRNPLKMLVASRWGDEDYEASPNGYHIKRVGPKDFKELEYKAGEGLLLDNFCDAKQRVPHSGVRTKNKAFMRSYAIKPVE